MTVEELQVLVTANTRGLQSQMNDLTRRLQGVQRQSHTMSQGLTRTFTNLKRTLIGLGIGKMIKGMFDLSRTYEAATQQVNRIFRDNASAIESWIDKNATTFGMARADAMQYASIYGNLVKGFEKDTKRMSQYTTQLLEATTVIASNTGRTVQDVSERIRSGLLGNTEAIEDLGIYANVAMIKTTDAFKTIANGRTWENLTYQEQQQIRLMSIIEQSASQFGTSIQQNTNYQLMQLTANLKNVALNLGNAFMPIVSTVLPVLNAMALALANVTNKIAAFMNTLFGTNFNTGAGEVQQVAAGAGEAAKGYEDMSDAADNAGNSAKKAGKAAKNAIAGFDEINQLAKDNGSGGSGGAGGGATGVGAGAEVSSVMSEAAESFAAKVEDVINRLKDLFKEGFEIGLGGDFQSKIDDIKKSIQGIKDSLKDIFTDPQVTGAFNKMIESWALNAGKITGSFVSIGTTIAQNLLGGLNKYLDQNKEYIKERLSSIMNVTAEISDIIGNFAVAFADIFSVFGSDTAQQITADLIGIFNDAFLGIIDLGLRFGRDILNCITQPIIDNKDAIKTALLGMLEGIQTITGTLHQMVQDIFTKAFEVYDTAIKPAFDKIALGFSSLLETVLDFVNTYLVPTFQSMANDVKGFYEQNLKPLIDKVLDGVGKIADILSTLFTNWIVPIVNFLIDTLGPCINGIVKIVWDAIKKICEWVASVLDAVMTVINDILDAINALLHGDLIGFCNSLFKAFDDLIKGILDIVLGAIDAIVSWIWDTLVTAVTSICESLKILFGQALEGIKILFSDALKAIGKFFTDCWNGIKNTWQGVSSWFSSSVIEPTKNFFSTGWSNIKTFACTTWDNIKSAWQVSSSWFATNVCTPIKGKFSEWKTNVVTLGGQAWNGLKTAWSTSKNWFNDIATSISKKFSSAWTTIKNAGSNAWSAIKNSCRSAINGIIDHINGLIRKMNNIGFNMPDALGGGHVGFNIPSIPRLARGGIVDGATYMGGYIAGEAGKEMIVPLENTAFTDKIATAMGQAVMNAMSVMLNGSYSGNNGQNVTLEMDGMILARTITPYVIREMKRLEII